jgi:hypothetical protein
MLLLALSAGAPAWAEQDPYYVGASLGVTHYSNVFQTTGSSQSDTVVSAGVLGGIDLRPGRQHLYGTASAQANRYGNFSELNNVSYALAAGLDWETIERLSGSFHIAADQSLANYADIQLPTVIKDVQRSRQASAAVRYGLTPRFGLEGSVAHRTVDFSAEEDKRDYRQNIASLGVRWTGTGLLTLGAAARLTKNDFPAALIVAPVPAIPPLPAVPGVYAPDKSDRKDIDLTGTYTPSGISSFTARVSFTRETHSQPAIPTFSGVTGSLSWDYRPTGKLSFNTTITRDTGSETTFAGLPNNFSPLRVDNNSLNTILDAQARWEATAKILVTAGLRHINGSVLDVLGRSSDATTDSLILGANYAFSRSIEFSCNVGYETRSSSYNASTVGCAGRITLR